MQASKQRGPEQHIQRIRARPDARLPPARLKARRSPGRDTCGRLGPSRVSANRRRSWGGQTGHGSVSETAGGQACMAGGQARRSLSKATQSVCAGGPALPAVPPHPPSAARHGWTAAGRRGAPACHSTRPARCRTLHGQPLGQGSGRALQGHKQVSAGEGAWSSSADGGSAGGAVVVAACSLTMTRGVPDLVVCVAAPPSCSCVTSSIVTPRTTSGPVRNM